MLPIHPLLSRALPKEDPFFKGGTLKCKCSNDPVEVTISSNILYNHLCGCSKCWKPKGYLFSLVAAVSKDSLSIKQNSDKLELVDPKALVKRLACKECGIHMLGYLESTDHPYKEFNFIHPELLIEKGWTHPRFAAFVSSVLESGLVQSLQMSNLRQTLTNLNITPYDCPSPELMDIFAKWKTKTTVDS